MRTRPCITAITRSEAAGNFTRKPARWEGIVSKRADAAYEPGNCGLWVKVKCMNREEFIVVGWTAPKDVGLGSARCCSRTTTPMGGWFMPAGPGRALTTKESERLWRRLQPLITPETPLDVPPPRTSRFGSALVLSRVHWVRPELVAEVKHLT